MFFKAMSSDCGISPTIENYTCTMDLMGRAGHLDEALHMAKTMAFQPNGKVWITMWGAYRLWGNVEVGRQAFKYAMSLDEKDAASYVLCPAFRLELRCGRSRHSHLQHPTLARALLRATLARGNGRPLQMLSLVALRSLHVSSVGAWFSRLNSLWTAVRKNRKNWSTRKRPSPSSSSCKREMLTLQQNKRPEMLTLQQNKLAAASTLGEAANATNNRIWLEQSKTSPTKFNELPLAAARGRVKWGCQFVIGFSCY